MHLLAATAGSADDGADPIDLAQTPADVVVISAADTELAALCAARAEMDTPPDLRLANMMHLTHPMSVDMHIDRCAAHSKLVVARILGGASYWRYGFEQYASRLAEAGVLFAALPGDDKPDPELRRFSSVTDADYDALWAYLVEAGPKNTVNFLHFTKAIIAGDARPEAAEPLLRAGVYWPAQGITDLSHVQTQWADKTQAVVPIIFYRALVQGAGLNPINRLIKSLIKRRLNPLPIFVASLKDTLCAATLTHIFEQAPPDVILNCTAFAAGAMQGGDGQENPLAQKAANDAPVFQVILSSGAQQVWEQGKTGLSARDIAMNVALPEVDGRILSRAISFKGEAFFDTNTECPIATYKAHGDRVEFVADLAANWVQLRRQSPQTRKVALIMANYPNKDGRLANGVGLDTPTSVTDMLHALANQGYQIEDAPANADALMQRILDGPTNWLAKRADKKGGVTLPLARYHSYFAKLPYEARRQITERWGAAENDPFIGAQGFKLSIFPCGNAALGVQPARGYNIDPIATYHAPDLVPPHHYLAFYFWLRFEFKAHAIVHMGKHGNLEWLPGKAVCLSEECLPEVVLGPMPHIYPFIVNDPGEGTQAKRRAQAVIIDHLTPPLTRAETYGPLRDLEALVDEYYEAAGVDPRRTRALREQILSLSSTSGLDQDIGFIGDTETDLAKLDAYLCELKEAQIRDGLHIFGTSPTGRQLTDLCVALARMPRADAKGGNASLLRALADDFELNFDPLDCDMAAPWNGPRPAVLAATARGLWRTHGDTIERLETYAAALVAGESTPPDFAIKTQQVMAAINQHLRPAVTACGQSERKGFMRALAAQAVAAGPSGAPTRGRPDVLPTGRNFYSVDSRAVPTPTAWALGWKSANLLLETHLQTHGDWPRAMLLTAWGTANMRTGGDDIAQCLALMGLKPTWDSANRRVTGFEIIPASALGRPRVDVTLRVSGFFRDAFPALIDLVDSAAAAVAKLDEPPDINPAKANGGGARVYGSKPGAYGAGLQALIDERIWREKEDFARAYLEWGSYAYGKAYEGRRDTQGLKTRLSQVEAIVQNQDNREHDLLDSDDYYQFHGGAAAAVSALQGTARPIYHNDHSRPERPIIRTLEDEMARVVRSRVVNPKWIEGVKRHGYKGAFEMAATVDYMFAFAATTGAVKGHHFDAVHSAYLEDEHTRDFLNTHNAPALREIAQRLQEAIERGLWQPRSNSARAVLAELSRA